MSEGKSNKAKLWGALVTLLLAVIFILDICVGYWNSIGQARQLTHRFRSESVPLETATRHLRPDIDHQYPADDRPLEDKFVTDDSTRKVRTDHVGLLQGPETNNAAWRTILFLGGSTTENNEVDEAFRFPYLVGALLSKSMDATIKGANAGVRGHTTQESLSVLLNHPAKSIDDASVAVVMHNINDRLLLAIKGTYKSELNKDSSLSGIGILKSIKGTLDVVYQNIRYGSNIIFLLDKVVTERLIASQPHYVSDQSFDLKDPDISKSRSLFSTNLTLLVTSIRLKGKVPVLMTQPLGRESSWQDEFNEEIRLIGAKLDVLVIDLDSEIKNHERADFFYPDAIHFNNAGSVWAAKFIAKALEEKVFREGGIKKETLDGTVAASSCISKHKWGTVSPDFEIDRLNVDGRYGTFDNSGRYLLLKRYTSTGNAIELIDRQTGKTKSLAEARLPDELKHPTWGGKNSSFVVYLAKRGTSNDRLYRFDIQSGVETMIEIGEGLIPGIPSVGLDETIYFAGYKHDKNKKFQDAPDLYSLSGDGKILKQLTKTPWEEWRPVPSPDGKALYFISDQSGAFDIYRMDLKRGGIEKIVGIAGDQWDPALSKDGLWLAYSSRDTGNFDMFLLALGDTKSPVRLTTSVEDEWDPAFTADSRALLYATTTSKGSKIRAMCMNNIK